MQKHTKLYMDYFNYSEGDYIPSELSGGPAVDIHHIEYGRSREDKIENLIALTREEHEEAHEGKLTKEYLKKSINNLVRMVKWYHYSAQSCNSRFES